MERKWWTLLVVCVGTFMLLLDITIVNVALPKIASDLHASFSDIQWVIDAYALTLASVLPTAGALADLTGRRRMYAVGLALFSLASLLCALSPRSLFLIIARAGQGLGGAVMLAISALTMVLFLISQVVQKPPMFALQLFRKPTFDGAWIVALTMSAAMFAMFLYITLYIQTLLGYSPLQTGLRFLPFTVVSFFAAAASGRLSDRIPIRVLLGGGLAMVAVGLFLMRGITASSGWTELLPGFVIAGAGVGFVNPALASASIGVVPPQRSGMASGINNTFRQVGTATGIAVLGAIFESRISGSLAPKLTGTPAAGHTSQIAHAVAAGGTPRVLAATPAAARHQAAVAIHASFTGAMNDIFLVAGVIALTGGILA